MRCEALNEVARKTSIYKQVALYQAEQIFKLSQLLYMLMALHIKK